MKIIYAIAAAAVVATPMAASAQSVDGLRFGLELGLQDGSSNATGDDELYGAFVGYDANLGAGVIGGELVFRDSDLTASNGTVLNDTIQLKARYGQEIGGGLLYGTIGLARASASTGGTDNGYLVGVGYEYGLTEQVFLGGELQYSEFQNVGATNADVGSTSIAVRLGYKF